MVTRFSILLISILIALMTLILFTNGLAMIAPSPSYPDSTMVSPDRGLEPIIVKGVFPGVSVDQIFVYREINGNLEQIPFQIDELTVSNAYTSTEDLIMDANDEIVFMAGDLGDEAMKPISATLPVRDNWYIVEVTDPLNPMEKGWAYIVYSNELTRTTSVDYVNFLDASQRISATNYTLGWATDFGALDHLSIFGSGNIVDRSKLRIMYSILGEPQPPLTENDLPAPETNLIKDGSVRVILGQGVGTTLAYASLQHSITPIDLTELPSSVTIDKVRLSLDLIKGASNGTYFNEYLPDGVVIDGNADPVSADPVIRPWLQVSLESGSFIQIINVSAAGGVSRHYYKDDSSPDPEDTGDGRSYGDSGMLISNPTSKYVSFESSRYYLSGHQDNRGDEFYEMNTNPLIAKVTPVFAHATYLPLVIKGD